MFGKLSAAVPGGHHRRTESCKPNKTKQNHVHLGDSATDAGAMMVAVGRLTGNSGSSESEFEVVGKGASKGPAETKGGGIGPACVPISHRNASTRLSSLRHVAHKKFVCLFVCLFVSPEAVEASPY